MFVVGNVRSIHTRGVRLVERGVVGHVRQRCRGTIVRHHGEGRWVARLWSFHFRFRTRHRRSG
jgi:hypothetical protein